MTQKEFIKVLDEKGISYEMEGDKIVVIDVKGIMENVILDHIKTLPPNVKFMNSGEVDLEEVLKIPKGIIFENGDNVSLDSLKILNNGVKFNNKGIVWLQSVKTIHPGVEFHNGNVNMERIIGRLGWFDKWEGNIEGISSNRLLNLMISKGVFI